MLTEEAVITGSMIYMMLNSIDPAEHLGKSARKHISRAIKKELAIHRKTCKSKSRYSYLVNKGYELIFEARDEMKVDELKTDPGVIIGTLMLRWPDMVAGLNISADKVNILRDIYRDSHLQFESTQYSNRMSKVISRFLNGEKNEQDEYN